MKLLACLAILAIGVRASAQEDGADPVRRLRDKLATTKITLDFTNAKLDDVIAYVQEYSGLNFHIDEAARATDEGSGKITIKLRDVSVKSALRLILHPRDLRCVFRNGVVVVTTKARLGSRMVTRVYDIRDIMLPLRDFEGPLMELYPPGSSKMGIIPFLGGEEANPPMEMEFVVELIKASISDSSWEGDASILQAGGLLIISQTASVHGEVGRLLDRLRLYR